MKFNLWSLILLSPETGDGGGTVASGGATGSAPDASPLGQLYPTSVDGKAENDAKAAADPAKAAEVAAAKAAEDAKKVADEAAAKAKTDPPAGDKPKEKTAEELAAEAKAKAEAPQKLTAENKTALEKALADATTDEAKAAAKAALDKAVEDDKKATEAEAAAAKAAEFDAGKITMPDGVEVDSKLLAEVAPVFKELGLGQVAGQKVVDQYIKIKQDEAAQHAETVQSWYQAASTDKEIGGPKWEKTQETAKAGLKKFIETHPGTEDINGLLVASGFGNHPAFIKLFNDYGKMTADDTPVTPQAKAGHQQKSALAILYPDAPQG